MNVYLVVVESMHDWELGYLMAELRSRRYFADPACPLGLRLVGLGLEPVTSMGGAIHVPELTLETLRIERDDALLLPGCAHWDAPQLAPVYALAKQALALGAGVAAIGTATVGLARAGILDDRRHTSCPPELLAQLCPEYRGARWYRREAAVRGENLITASNLGSLEFSYEVLKMLKVWRPETASAWYRWHKTRQPQWYQALLESLPAYGAHPCEVARSLL